MPAALSAGLLTRLSAGLPLGTIQDVSPVFKLIAVMRPYGPLISGRPITLGPPSPPAAMYCISDRVPPGCNAEMYGAVVEGMYNMPVSGSTDPPIQLAPPPAPGSWMVPSFPPASLTMGGV